MMIIRDIKKEEKEIFFKMIKDFYTGTDACLHDINIENCEKTFEECLRSHTYARMLFIEEEKKAVGYCLLSFTWSMEAGGMVVLVEEVYFQKEARGKGYGKQLFSWLEQEYPETSRFRLEATYNNESAISLYRKLGYEELHYYQMIKEQ